MFPGDAWQVREHRADEDPELFASDAACHQAAMPTAETILHQVARRLVSS